MEGDVQRCPTPGVFIDMKGLIVYSKVVIFCLQLSTCDVCQHMNRKMTTGTPQLNPIPVKAPWYMLGIDYVGPISPTAADGSRFILTITDYFTKWAEAIPTKDKSAASTATVLFKVKWLQTYMYNSCDTQFY